MSFQQLLDRISTLSETMGHSAKLEALASQTAHGEIPSANQLHHLLQQELRQRQRLGAELQTLIRQLGLYVKWHSPQTWSESLSIASSQFLGALPQTEASQSSSLQSLEGLKGSFTVTADALITEVDETTSELLGVPAEALVGQSFLEFIGKEEGKKVFSQTLEKVSRQPQLVERCEIILASAQGNCCLVTAHLSQGKPDGDHEQGSQFYGELKDISRFQDVQQTLSVSEKTWRALFDQSFQMMALLDAQGRIIDLNQTALQLVQGTLEQVKDQYFWEVPWWQQSNCAQVKQSIKLAKVGGIVRYEIELRSEKGKSVPIDLSLKPVLDEGDQVVLLIAEGRDLRDRVQKETELRREKEISESIIKSLPGVFYMIRKDGPCIKFNQELKKITGYVKEEIEQMDPLDFFVESDQALVENKIQETFEKGRSTVEARFFGKNHQTTTCHLSNVCLSLEDDQEYLIGVGIDMTETNHVKNERQKLATLVENSSDLIGLATLDGKVQFLNPAGQDLLGIHSKDHKSPLLLQDCFCQISEQDFQQEIFYSILKRGQWYGELALYNQKNSSAIPVLANIFLICDSATATPMNLGVITRNISDRKETEIALKTSEERFRSIFEQAAVGIALLDIAGCFQRINQRGCEILGYVQEELLTRSYHELISMEQASENDDFVKQLVRGEINTFSQEQQYHRKDGSWVWVNLTMSLISSPQGEPQSLLAILEDISDRKSAEAALQESEEEYRSLVNGIREVIFQVDREGVWCFLNPAWEEITGYSLKSSLGKRFLDYTYFEDISYNEEQFYRLTNQEQDHCRYEVRYQTAAGDFCWMEVTARVTINQEGIVTGVTGTLNDITERRQAEDQLRAVINTVPGLVSWVSRDGHYLGVNEQLAHTLNLQPDDFVGKEIGFLNASSSFVRFMYEFLASGETEASQIIENTLKNGQVRSFLIAAQKYRQASAAVLIGIDVTERKRAEIALQESENQFRQLAENIEQVFWMIDLNKHNFIYISPAYESTWGRSIKSAYNSPNDWLKAVHPEDYNRVLRATQKQIHGEYDEEYRIVRPDGEVRWLHDRAFPVRNEKGQVYRLAGITEDITERKQAKQALKKRERYLKALVGVQRRLLASTVDESLYQEVLAILGDACEASRIYVYENVVGEESKLEGQLCAQWCDSNPYTKISEKNNRRFIYEDDLGEEGYEKLRDGEFLQTIVSDLPQDKQALFTEENTVSFLMLPLTVNGEFFGIIGFDNCEVDNNWGRLEVGLLSSAAAAIALAKERQLTQETLQQQLTAIETTNDGIVIIQTSGEFHYVNPAYCQMLGYSSPATLSETHWRSHHPDQEIPRIDAEIFPKLQSQGYWTGEIEAKRRDSSTFIQELSMNLTQNGEIVGVCRDISERKAAEEQLKASLEEKELLLKEVHHRVKNNLQVISSIFSLQSQTIEDEQVLAILEESQNRISSMALIHEKLYQSVNLANIDFVEYIRDLTYHLLASYNVNPDWVQTEMNIQSIQLNLDSAIPCGLLINELVSNSLKHGFPHQRSGKIYIFLGVKDQETETFCLKVEDDGVGLPQGFNPRKATSLGVSLITSLTQQLRGKLKFQNNPGASFEITFPKPIERKRF